MPSSPQVVVFDVNETLSDMSPLAAGWEAVGARAQLAQQWFAEVLRDGFALAAAEAERDFATIAADTARRLLSSAGVGADVDTAVAQLMAGLTELDVHPDVPDGVRALHAQGLRLVTLSNGAASVADGLLSRAGIRSSFERLLSVQDAGRWKPAPQAYRHALTACGVDASDAMLVAVHPWDVDGAARAGLRTAWIDRAGSGYPSFFRPPELAAGSLVELADLLLPRAPSAGDPPRKADA